MTKSKKKNPRVLIKDAKIIEERTIIIPNTLLTLRPALPLGTLQFYLSEGRGGVEEVNIYLYYLHPFLYL